MSIQIQIISNFFILKKNLKWLRLPAIRKNRECIVPEISRTFHFGTKGLNMNTNFHDRYFKKHAFNRQPNVKLHDVDRY